MHDQIKDCVTQNKVFLFMKGTPEAPSCGFSARVVKVLNHVGAEYASANVLADDELREAIKTYSDWPTLPQLYVNVCT